MISSRKTAETAARLGNINQVVDASAAFEQRITLRDTLTTSAVAEVAAWANTGTVSITTGGVATFTNTVTPAVVGDTFESGGALYTVSSITTPNTVMVVTPAPTSAVSGATFVFNNAGSYVDLPAVSMAGLRPVPEQWRVRFGGSGTVSATWQFERVTAAGVRTAITTAVASTAAAVWQGVSAVATEQTTLQKDDFIRLRFTAVTTMPAATTRSFFLEAGFNRKTGPHLQ